METPPPQVKLNRKAATQLASEAGIQVWAEHLWFPKAFSYSFYQHIHTLVTEARIGAIGLRKTSAIHTGKPPFRSLLEIKPLVQRPLILLATATITTENMFSNGLFQNVFLLYRIFDAMGWTPLLLVNSKPKTLDGVPELLKHCRVISAEDLVMQPIPIKAYIESGMSLDSSLRRFQKMTGARICKLYLGNILNIDIEAPVFYPGMNFSHHVVCEMQEIWVSPHYAQHSEYAAVLNHVDPGISRQQVATYGGIRV
jgi:hypothetical protein